MLFNFALCSSLLLAPAVLAIPSGLGARVMRRREGRQSQPNGRLEQSAASNTVYSNNWAGAVLEEGEGTFASVGGTFTVPTPSGSPDTSASAWVGIDGGSCQSAILQTGIDFTVSPEGPTYDAWYEFFPQVSHDFTDITISAGDVIYLNVTASSANSGIAVIENMTTGKTVSKSLTSSAPLCRQDAEWIVEDYMQGSSLVPFANFDTVTFTGVQTTGAGTYDLSSATIMDISQNNQVLTSTSISGSSITIHHV